MRFSAIIIIFLLSILCGIYNDGARYDNDLNTKYTGPDLCIALVSQMGYLAYEMIRLESNSLFPFFPIYHLFFR